MSPILVRPVREQLEHDRLIRLLQAKNRRKFDAGINPGAQQNVPVGSGPSVLYPDVVLSSLERGHRLQAIIEVETGESVNHLEALAEWAHFARVRVPFLLYVPSSMVDVARQLCDDNHIAVSEIWSFHALGDDVRFALIHRAKEAAAAKRPSRPATAVAPKNAPAKPAKPMKAAKPPKPAKPAKQGKPLKAAKAKPKPKPSNPAKRK